jgi:hypothetical protein
MKKPFWEHSIIFLLIRRTIKINGSLRYSSIATFPNENLKNPPLTKNLKNPEFVLDDIEFPVGADRPFVRVLLWYQIFEPYLMKQ